MATQTKKNKNIFLFVGRLSKDTLSALEQYKRENGIIVRTAFIYTYDKKRPTRMQDSQKLVDFVLECPNSSPESIQKALEPISSNIRAVTCYGDGNIPFFQKIIPLLPKHVHTPSVSSLEATTNKIIMRRALRRYNKAITPKFMVVDNDTKKTVSTITKVVGFPLVVKPAGLGASLLVSICYHEDELTEVLNKTFKKINSVYKKRNGCGTPQILVEQYMEGDVYSIDAYVSPEAKIYFNPPVRAINGRAVGFDDFFEYKLTTPTSLNKESIKEAERVATQTILATGLTSSSAHIELMRTEEGWKVIELGPRVGGWRDDMYRLSFGIEHRLNDLFIRIPKKPVIHSKIVAYTAVMQFYPKKEGRLVSTKGIQKAKRLDSFYKINIRKKIGSRCKFAKNGGKPIFDITLTNKSRTSLLADIRRLEQTTSFETK